MWCASRRSPASGGRDKPWSRHGRRGPRRSVPSPEAGGIRRTSMRGAWARRRSARGPRRASAGTCGGCERRWIGRRPPCRRGPSRRSSGVRSSSATRRRHGPSSLRSMRPSCGPDRACSPGMSTWCSGARTGCVWPVRTGQGRRPLLTRLLEANAERAEQVFFLGQEVAPEDGGQSSIAFGRSRRTCVAGRSRWSPRSGPIRTGSSPRRRRRPERCGRCSSPKGSPGGPGRSSSTSRRTTSTFRRSSASARRSRPIPARCSVVTHDDPLADTCTTTRWELVDGRVVLR